LSDSTDKPAEGAIYEDGTYFERNPTWDIEDSPWKAELIMAALERAEIDPQTICEVGCGAGEILRVLQDRMDGERSFVGYEISPQAYELCKGRVRPGLDFKLMDILDDDAVRFDLVLLMDVLEHVEDYYSFLRALKARGSHFVIRVPMDLSVRTLVRNKLPRERWRYGHIQYFTRETALAVLKECGYEVLDWQIDTRTELHRCTSLGSKLEALVRKMTFAVSRRWTAKYLGSCSLLVVAR
jgi:cyclopropane fatty-acyl-phospholipid synthase-like methyltransferase